ncbi:MAG: hypothetical protein WC758_03065 [Candidatus Woesearchaeota archaeon]|jgi:hypothetical protein
MNKKNNCKFNRKAGIGMVLSVIIGLLLFVFLFASSCNAITKAFRSYKNSEQSNQNFIDAITEVNLNGPGSLKLANLKLNDDSAIYVFADNLDVIEYYTTKKDPVWLGNAYDLEHNILTNNILMYRKIISRPVECTALKTCVCLCTNFASKKLNEYDSDKIKLKYTTGLGADVELSGVYSLDCTKLTCNSLDDVKIQKENDLIRITTDTMYKNIQAKAREQTTIFKDSYIFRWEGGFSVWKTDLNTYNYLAKSNYLDLFVVKNYNGEIMFCLDGDCLKRTGTI